jgi:hypothetical protein
MEELIEKIQPRHKKIRFARKESIEVHGIADSSNASVELQEPNPKLDDLKNL